MTLHTSVSHIHRRAPSRLTSTMLAMWFFAASTAAAQSETAPATLKWLEFAKAGSLMLLVPFVLVAIVTLIPAITGKSSAQRALTSCAVFGGLLILGWQVADS
ncbi:MAG: hypothetical protein IT290_09865, partial [Deltaproteobacteria bacterium]|nr:hypothetical protein [Deltaproteobacteria bacterium]